MVRGDVDMVFNGEIYNFRRVRPSLEEQGVQFETSGDSEVFLNAFLAQGEKCFDGLDGMWAVAFLDKSHLTLTLSRDFFGEKPLYYILDGGTFCFSSNILALCKLYGRLLPLNRAYLTHFLQSGFAPPDCTAFDGVRRLEARQTVVLDLRSMTLRIRDRQPLFDASLLGTGAPFSLTCFENLFAESLEDRLVADVPLGLMLSGGIDSSYVAATARHILDYKLECLTIRYGWGSEAETDRAHLVAKILGLPHHVVDVPKSQLETLVEVAVPSMDEPISDVAYPLLLRIVGATPAETRVLLTGDGADELFLSYANYRRFLPHLTRRPTWPGRLSVKGAGVLSGAPYNLRRMWRGLTTTLLPMSATQMLEMELAFENGTWKLGRIGGGDSPSQQLSAIYAHAYENNLAEHLLVKSDRASMWHSKEFRTPFLNRKLLNYVGGCCLDSLPWGVKFHLVKSLNEKLGVDLGFSKRGMFARGEYAFQHLSLLDLTPYGVPRPTTPQERYRNLILGKWITYNNIRP